MSNPSPQIRTVPTALLCATLAWVALLSGCGKIDRISANLTGLGQAICQNGVEYLQFSSGVSVAYTPDGKIKTCSR